jgi:hypothetical protein
LLQPEDDTLLLRRRCDDDDDDDLALCEPLKEEANLANISALACPEGLCERCLNCLMVSLLRRNSRRVAAPEERASAGLQIEEAAIELLKSIARVAAGKAIASRRTIEALVEEGIRVVREEGEVEEWIAVVVEVLKLNRMIVVSAERRELAVGEVGLIAAEVDGEESD